MLEEITADFTTDELREFLEADRRPVLADPLFKETLRVRLWALLQAQRLEPGRRRRSRKHEH